jgi:large subunit ribosomal protein L32e
MPKKPILSEEEVRLLKVRAEKKKREPEFVRQESWRYVRIKPNWRRPRGIDSKMRLKRAGKHKLPNIGYKGPELVRGIHPSGFREKLVCNVRDLEGVDPSRVAVRIGATVGRRKRMEIIKRADELGIKVLNR